MNSFNRICVVGLGYIGLPTAAVFAENGVEIVGVDTNARVVETINAGKPHFGEPNLDALVRRVVEGGKLRAAPAPEATPKPSASGSATTPTVRPAMRSFGHVFPSPR